MTKSDKFGVLGKKNSYINKLLIDEGFITLPMQVRTFLHFPIAVFTGQ